VRDSVSHICLSVDFDERGLEEIVCRCGIDAWNDWVGRLFDANLTASVWAEGNKPPPIIVIFRFPESVRQRWPGGDFCSAWFDSDAPEGSGIREKAAYPVEEHALETKVTCLVDRS